MHKALGLSLVIMILAGVFLWANSYIQSYADFKRDAFSQLQSHRTNKKDQILRFLNVQKETAKNSTTNPLFQTLFRGMLKLSRMGDINTSAFQRIERQWEELYVADFGLFYDLLLLDAEGNIFFTIKKERDLGANLSNPYFQGLDLWEKFQGLDEEVKFVDFQIYPASGEQAAFFLVPIQQGSQPLGAVALQLPINQINQLLSNREEMGSTGEVYLVNSSHTLLTESRFIRYDPERPNLKINTQAAMQASEKGLGQMVLKDYRGKNVLSSFERFFFEGVELTIIAEIDESEVLANYYLKYQDSLFPQLLSESSQTAPHPDKKNIRTHRTSDSTEYLKVDVQEFRRNEEGKILYTNGVSTCTALSIYIPGKFGYLAHIAPTDSSYGISWPTSLLLGAFHTDFVNETVDKILWFDLHPKNLSQLTIDVMGVQPKAMKSILRTLLERGITLNQIRVGYQPDYESVSVDLDAGEGKVMSYWNPPSGMASRGQIMAEVAPLEVLLKSIVDNPTNQ